jgi:hypothetical protein
MAKPPAKRIAAPRKARVPPRKPVDQKKDRGPDSDDIERAIYDGMQDLRTKKPG